MNAPRVTRWAAAAAVLALAGCVVAPLPPYRGEVVVGVPPPAEPVEVIPPPPVVGYVWIGGFWNWIGGRHVWTRGHWAPPRPGYRWEPRRWEPMSGDRGDRGYRERGGRWERDVR